jgi:hypothetical protein
MRTTESCPFVARRSVASRARVIAIIAIVCGGLAAPGTARAADPFGTADLMMGGEVDAAVAEAAALVPQEGGKTWASAAPATSTSSVQPAASESGSALEAAVTEAAAAASTATNEVGGSAASPPATSVRSTMELRVRAGPHVRTRTVRRASSSSRRSVSATRSLTLVTSSGRSVARASVTSRTTVVTGSARIRRAHDARPTHTAPAGVLPQRLPPVPLPPHDATTSGQGGGQGPLMPLVVGALSAVMLFLAFELLRRVLSRPAIRKPRRISLPPWHPG